MNYEERCMLVRIYRTLDAVPAAQGSGVKSATVSGVASFSHDISIVRKHCGDAMLALADGAIGNVERHRQFEDAISQAERYIAERKVDDWKAL